MLDLKKIILFFLLLAAPFPACAQDVAPVKESDILPFLEQVISLHRSIGDSETLPDNAREVLLKDRLRQNSKKLLQKSFEFARAQAAVFGITPPSEASLDQSQSRRLRLLKAMADSDKRVAELQSALGAPKLKDTAREKLKGDLKLAKARQELIKTMVGIFNSEGDNSGLLIDQVNALSRTVIDDSPDQQQPGAKDAAVVKSAAPKEENIADDDGLFRLSTSMFSYSRKKTEIDNLLQQVRELAERNQSISLSIRAALRSALAEGNALSAENGSDPKGLAEYRKSIDALMVRYKQLAATIIPVGEMNVILEKATRNLEEWSRLVNDDWNRVFRQLIIRLVILGIAVAIPFILSLAARRAISRYVKDSKRKRQLNIARRVILIALLAFVVLANFITEFGSLATFAGFITAGLAVALQTVLVSLVAHFFFFGRYGVRAGDRITVSGVTGDVVQIGLLRLYMRELKSEDDGWASTGKIVAFPNSILFQPTAFYKHMDQ
jgi:hypothetical protein